MNETTQSALLYAKFRSSAGPLKAVVQEIEQRISHEEYATLLNECYQAYFSIRIRLITPIIMTRMAEISGNKDIVPYCRSAFYFLRGVCQDEFDLFFQFFSIGEKDLYRYLTDLSEPLYDHVRPRIIHEPHIVALSELCLLFQTQFMRDPDEAESVIESSQFDFGILVQPALQDAQSRLVFRTENVIVSEIQNFVPKDRDLEYPRLLHVPSGSMMSPIVKSPDVMSPMGGSNEFFDSGILFQGWYPTLRKSIWILSKIYRLVNVFHLFSLAYKSLLCLTI
jgi:conserved oligomeric Golgi complex subunit 3